LMTDFLLADDLVLRPFPYDESRPKTMLTLGTGRHETLFIKGIAVYGNTSLGDFIQFQNNAAQTVVFEDIRSKLSPLTYRNGPSSYGQSVYLENVEWAYNGAFPAINNLFTRQAVWCWNFNSEMNITPEPIAVKKNDRSFSFSRFTHVPKIVNDGGRLWVFGQKLGEFNGVYIDTRNGGRSELLSVFFNQNVSNVAESEGRLPDPERGEQCPECGRARTPPRREPQHPAPEHLCRLQLWDRRHRVKGNGPAHLPAL
jgi:hypothetical protein